MALLEEISFKATAIDLTGCGIDSTDPNKIATLAQYAKPLTEFFENLGDEEKVIISSSVYFFLVFFKHFSYMTVL